MGRLTAARAFRDGLLRERSRHLCSGQRVAQSHGHFPDELGPANHIYRDSGHQDKLSDGPSLKLRDAFHTDGSVAIEYGLILPVLLLFTFGLIDAGRLLWTNITLTRATEVAARCGAVGAITR